MAETSVLQHLHKLSDCGSPISQENLANVLQTLWKSRRTGLNSQQKLEIQSLLNLPSSQQLDPILACLRLLIRKCVHENLLGVDLLKLFPPGLSHDLQNNLQLLLQKYQGQWKKEASRDQTAWQRPSISHDKYGAPPSTPSSATDVLSSLRPQQHELSSRFNHNDKSPAPNAADTSVPDLPSPQGVDGPDNLGIVPRLKSMTWTMQNHKSKPAERVSIISLKLHDYTKSASGEREVKFQLNQDTLEAMLTSMTYISNQLSEKSGPSSGPLQKRPRV